MVNSVPESLGKHLKKWRGLRGLSQFDLALHADVSARHLSFIETGRSQPSREMVIRLADTLNVPLRDRNMMLLAAGYAPAYRETPLDDESMEHVRNALAFVLDKHEPYPAFVLDRKWNIVQGNRIHQWLLARLLPEDAPQADPLNALQLVFDPDLLKPFIVNWNVVASVLLRRASNELETVDADHDLIKLLEWATSLPHVKELRESAHHYERFGVLIPMVFDVQGRMLSWFSTIASFGTPQDITLQELRIECLFPADSDTEAYVRKIGLQAQSEG